MRILLATLMMLAFIGCNQKPRDPVTPSTQAPEPVAVAGHSHERGKMQLTDAGSYHVLLTAHLSKGGHELHIYFETTGRNPKPIAIPLTSLKATVQVRTGEGELRSVEFLPAAAAERPKG